MKIWKEGTCNTTGKQKDWSRLKSEKDTGKEGWREGGRKREERVSTVATLIQSSARNFRLNKEAREINKKHEIRKGGCQIFPV